jgi:hypothetical protein
MTLVTLTYKVLEIPGDGLHCSEELLKLFMFECLTNSGAPERYTADLCKIAVLWQRKESKGKLSQCLTN